MCPVYEAVVIRSYLAIIEWEITYAPFLSPFSHHGLHLLCIVAVARHIVLSLIPYRSTYAVADDRMQHAVIEHRWLPVGRFDIGRLVWNLVGRLVCHELLDMLAVHPCLTA